MPHGLVAMPVRMPRSRRDIAIVRVLMMLVVRVFVFVFHELVLMQVLVLLRQVKPHARSHQHCRHRKLDRERLAKPQQRYDCTDEWSE
jgi:hypothetical protein